MFFLSDFCRLCLSFNSEFSSLCDDDIMEKLNACMSDLEFDDDLPSLICANCQENLDASFKFRNRCLRSEFILTSYINQFLGQAGSSTGFCNTNLEVNLFRNFDTSKIPCNVKVEDGGSSCLADGATVPALKDCTVKLNDINLTIDCLRSESSSLNVSLSDFENFVVSNSAVDLNVDTVAQQQSVNIPSEAEDDVFMEEEEEDEDTDFEVVQLPPCNNGLNTGDHNEENQQIPTEDGTSISTITTLDQPIEGLSYKRKSADASDDSAIKKCRIDTPYPSEFYDPDSTLAIQTDVIERVKIQNCQAHIPAQENIKEALPTQTQVKEKHAEIVKGNPVFVKLSDVLYGNQNKLQVDHASENSEQVEIKGSDVQNFKNKNMCVLAHNPQQEITHNPVVFDLPNTSFNNPQKKLQRNSVTVVHNGEQYIIKSTDLPNALCHREEVGEVLHHQVPTEENHFDTLLPTNNLPVDAVSNNSNLDKIEDPKVQNSPFLQLISEPVVIEEDVHDQVPTILRIDSKKLKPKSISDNPGQYDERDPDVQYIKTIAPNQTILNEQRYICQRKRYTEGLQDQVQTKYTHLETHSKNLVVVKTNNGSKFYLKPVKKIISPQGLPGNFVRMNLKLLTQPNSSQVQEIKTSTANPVFGNFDRSKDAATSQEATHSIPKTSVEELDIEKNIKTHFIGKKTSAKPTDNSGSLLKNRLLSNESSCKKIITLKEAKSSDKTIKLVVPPGTRMTSDVASILEDAGIANKNGQSYVLQSGQSVLLNTNVLLQVKNKVQDTSEVPVIKLNSLAVDDVNSRFKVHSLNQSSLKTVNLSYKPKEKLYSIANTEMKGLVKQNKLITAPVLKPLRIGNSQSILKVNCNKCVPVANSSKPQFRKIKITNVCSLAENPPAKLPDSSFMVKNNYRTRESNIINDLNQQIKTNYALYIKQSTNKVENFNNLDKDPSLFDEVTRPDVPKLTSEDAKQPTSKSEDSNNPHKGPSIFDVEPHPDVPILSNKDDNTLKKITYQRYINPSTGELEDSNNPHKDPSIFDEEPHLDVPIVSKKDDSTLKKNTYDCYINPSTGEFEDSNNLHEGPSVFDEETHPDVPILTNPGDNTLRKINSEHYINPSTGKCEDSNNPHKDPSIFDEEPHPDVPILSKKDDNTLRKINYNHYINPSTGKCGDSNTLRESSSIFDEETPPDVLILIDDDGNTLRKINYGHYVKPSTSKSEDLNKSHEGPSIFDEETQSDVPILTNKDDHTLRKIDHEDYVKPSTSKIENFNNLHTGPSLFDEETHSDVPILTNEDGNTLRKVKYEHCVKPSISKSEDSNNFHEGPSIFDEEIAPDVPILTNEDDNTLGKIKYEHCVKPSTSKSEDSNNLDEAIKSIFDEETDPNVPILSHKGGNTFRNTVSLYDFNWPDDDGCSDDSYIEIVQQDFKGFSKKKQNLANRADLRQLNNIIRFSTGTLLLEDDPINNQCGINLDTTVISSSNDNIGYLQPNYNNRSENILPTAMSHGCVTAEQKLEAGNDLLDVLALADQSSTKQSTRNNFIIDDPQNVFQSFKVCKGRTSESRSTSGKVTISKNKRRTSGKVVKKTDPLAADILASTSSTSIDDTSSNSTNSQSQASNCDLDSVIDVLGVPEEGNEKVIDLRINRMLKCNTSNLKLLDRKRATEKINRRKCKENVELLRSVLPKPAIHSNMVTVKQTVDTAKIFIKLLNDKSLKLHVEQEKVLERREELQNKLECLKEECKKAHHE